MTWRGDVGKLVEIRRTGLEELLVEWQIQDVLSLPGGSDESFLSNDFRFGNERWRLRLYPNWNREPRDLASGGVRLGLVKYEGGQRKVFHVTVDVRGQERSREVEKEFWGYDEYFWNDFCSRSEIVEHRTRLMPNDVFTITCLIKRVAPGTVKDVRSLQQPSSEVAPSKRSQSFNNQGIVLDDGGGSRVRMKRRFTVPVADDCLKPSFNWEDAYSAGVSWGVERGQGGPDVAGFAEDDEGVSGELGAGVNEHFRKEVETLMKRNEDLDRECEEQIDNNSKASSEEACNCMENKLLKQEIKSLMAQIKFLKKTVEYYQTLSENYSKQIGTLENELISCEEQPDCQENLTIVSGLKKDSSTQTDDECKDSKFLTEENESSKKQAAFDEDTMVENNENNNDEGHEESKAKKNVKPFRQVKRTKKISFPARHGGVIRSLRSILAKGRRADFTLRSGGGGWPVHRAILEGRSGHFETLFRTEWTGIDEVRVDTFAEGTLEGVLHFAYVGEVGDLSFKNAYGIYVAAHEFLLEDLKSLCVEFMKDGMRPEMVCDALAIAGTYQEGDLKESALECFFRESRKVFETEGWKCLKRNNLPIVAELFEECIKREKRNRDKERDHSL